MKSICMQTSPSPFSFRRSIRLPKYDYRQKGVYFVTLCTHENSKIFGSIRDGQVRLCELGTVVRDEWLHVAEARPNIQLDHFVVMPNHMHGLIIIEDSHNTNTMPVDSASREGQSKTLLSGSLGAIIGQFKIAVTRRAKLNQICSRRRIWQRNYHEHIVRNEISLNEIRQYIVENPARWLEDSLFVD